MCIAKKPKVQQMPDAPPPVTPVTEDTAAIDARNRERQRMSNRRGRASTILAGDTSAADAGPTTQSKTVLGQ